MAGIASSVGLKPALTLPIRQHKNIPCRFARNRNNITRAELITPSMLVISGCNVAMLTIGRFVAMPYQRRMVENAGMPVQNGQTHFESGDRLAEEASFILKTGDPSGFNVIDVLAWGSLGHAIGYAVLATASLQ